MAQKLRRVSIKLPKGDSPFKGIILSIPVAFVILFVYGIVHLNKYATTLRECATTSPKAYTGRNTIDSSSLDQDDPMLGENGSDAESDCELPGFTSDFASPRLPLSVKISRNALSKFSPRSTNFTGIKKVNGCFELVTTKYADNESVLATFSNLPKMKEIAEERIFNSLGIRLPENAPVIFRIKDMDEKYYHRFGIQRAQRITEYINGQEQIVVELFSEFISHSPKESQQLLTHEITHAVMRTIIGLDKFKHLPLWFKEGTAVFAAEQGENKLDKALAFSLPDNLRSCIDGLSGSHSLFDYAEDYLAIRFIQETYGKEILHKWISEIVYKKVDSRKAIEQVLSTTYVDFLYVTRKYALNAVVNWKNDVGGVQDFTDGYISYSRRSYQVALKFLQSALRESTSPSLSSRISFLLGKCYLKLKLYPIAIDHFKDTLTYSQITASVDQAIFFLYKAKLVEIVTGSKVASSEDLEEIEKGFVSVIYFYPYSKRVLSSYFYLGVLYHITGDYVQSTRFLEKYLSTFRGLTHGQAAKVLLGYNYEAVGDSIESRKYFVKAGIGDSKQINEILKDVRKSITDWTER